MKKVTRRRNIDTIFVLIVFSIFAFSVLMVLMLGASIYSNIHDISREGEDERLVLSYISTKVRNYDDAGNILVDDFNGVPALRIIERLSGKDYHTVIYNYNGWLYELFSEAALDFSLEDGMPVTRIDDLRFEETDFGLIKVSAGDLSVLLSPRSGFDTPKSGRAE